MPSRIHGVRLEVKQSHYIMHLMKNERHKLDLKESLAILSTLNNEISSYSVRDCFRLGKFKKQSTRPRPIMVKLNRVIDVTTILANRNLTPKGISIKPDLNQEDRQCESLLLGERWRLIQSGVDRKLIKIKSSAIYVQGRKHGQVLNNSFQYTNLHNQQNNPNTAQTSEDNDAAPIPTAAQPANN